MVNWKNKLLGFLHDPPSKALDIPAHQEQARTLLVQAGFTEEEAGQFCKSPDWAASAADRLPFPASQAAQLRCGFDGVQNCFHHPLGSRGGDTALTLPFAETFASAALGQETDQVIQPVISDFGSLPNDEADPAGERWRARFFAHWRLWQQHAVERDYRFAFLPADTRIPDHTIWTHMQVVSALAGCADPNNPAGAPKAAFLKVQLGPVQDFIAAARSIRDLWSGSYLLSWLMAAGLKAFSAKAGPDAVIFPNLRAQPLLDLHWRNDLWSRVKIGSEPVWDGMPWNNRDLLTPNLPNVFLAVVPAEAASELGDLVQQAIREEWNRIGEHVWTACQQAGLTKDEPGISEAQRKHRFDQQMRRFLSITWQATPWPDSLEAALKLADGFDPGTPIQTARQRVGAVIQMATKQMPVEHRDGRYYVGGDVGPKTALNNLGLGWSVMVAFNSWAMDAVRQTRVFEAANSGGWSAGAFNNKDALTGREEAVAGGRDWSHRATAAGSYWPALFKKGDWVSAATLVKRVWHRAYLEAVWGLQTDSKGFPMPNTRGVAAHEPEKDCGDDETAEDEAQTEKYFAVLALDGDEIGKWVSGEKVPMFASQVADYLETSGGRRSGARAYFDPPVFEGFLGKKRPLSPSYHLQFSEALSNFALRCARPIVETFDGRLVYAGGDDVVAVLPADTVLACAQALRLAFIGSPALKEMLTRHAHDLRQRHDAGSSAKPGKNEAPDYQEPATEGCLLDCSHPGFVSRLDYVDQQHNPVPFLVPGPAADCSAGIAIAHFKAPLQDVVRAAQTAEKRAKKGLGRSAVAVTLMKRSGEIIEWGCQWESGGLQLYDALAEALEMAQLSGKFPHRVVELIEPYVNRKTGISTLAPAANFESVVDEILLREFAVACERQRGGAAQKGQSLALGERLQDYLAHLDTSERKTGDLIGICQTLAFAHRTSGNGKTADSVETQTHSRT